MWCVCRAARVHVCAQCDATTPFNHGQANPSSNQPTNAMTLQRSRHIASTRVICAFAIHPRTARTYMPRRALTVGDITGRDACPCCDNLGPELGGICAHAPKKTSLCDMPAPLYARAATAFRKLPW